ncbi:MAG: sel1 repeat family protein [Pseudomonadota bacterium]
MTRGAPWAGVILAALLAGAGHSGGPAAQEDVSEPDSLAAREAARFEAALQHLQAGEAARAVHLFRTLAVSGHGAAQFNLAILHARGVGVPLDTLEANYWAWRARLLGEDRAAALSTALLAELPVAARNTLADRLGRDLEALAEAGVYAAFMARGRVEAEIRSPARLPEAAEWLIIASAFEVPLSRDLRDGLLRELTDAQRLGVEAAAREAFPNWCRRVPPATRPASCHIPAREWDS